MCGIFGWSFAVAPSQESFSLLAAVLSSENDHRGGDSWGFYAPETDQLRKGLGDLSRSVRPHSLTRHGLLMAHTRRASTGSVTKRNSHPFRLPEVVGAHNGIVTNHNWLNVRHGRDCAVDSEHIFRHLDEGLALDDIEAWGAVEFARPDTPDCIFLARFNGGELAVSRVTKGGEGIVWSSDEDSLERALAVSGMKGKPYQVDQGSLYVAGNGKLYTTESAFPISEPVRVTLTGRWWEKADATGEENELYSEL